MNKTDTTVTESTHKSDTLLQRIILGVEYLGENYNGWQRQNNGISVQQKVEEAASYVANHSVDVYCAGRTDSGVNATGQVVHFDTTAERNERNWILGINANLPRDIAVTFVKKTQPEFHARFDAVSRRYRYVILNQFARPAILDKRITWTRYPLDEKKMHEAAQALVGRHDFTSYRAKFCQAKSPVRTLFGVEVTRQGDCVYIDVHGDAFLHHMVRNITGVLIEIGEGHKPVEWAKQVLDVKDRTQGGVTAPPWGLYLVHVAYPQHFGVALTPRLPQYHF